MRLLLGDSSAELHCGSSDFWVMVVALKVVLLPTTLYIIIY